MQVHSINGGTLVVEGYPTVVCHCLLVESPDGLVLVDTGIGLEDVKDPEGRLGRTLIDQAGFQFHEWDTAARRIEAPGHSVEDVRDVVLTHCDPDHTGGLADFPRARIHLTSEELSCVQAGQERHVPSNFDHGPLWQIHEQGERDWFGLESRVVEVEPSIEIRLIPLPGHTKGHAGVAIRRGEGWVLHVGDAYYLRAELSEPEHPVSALATLRADDDPARRRSLEELRRLARDHAHEIEMLGYHDLDELPGGEAQLAPSGKA